MTQNECQEILLKVYTLCNGNEAFKFFETETESDAAGVMIPVIRNFLLFALCGFSLPSINHGSFRQMCIMQTPTCGTRFQGIMEVNTTGCAKNGT
jgi:hypothetical protein